MAGLNKVLDFPKLKVLVVIYSRNTNRTFKTKFCKVITSKVCKDFPRKSANTPDFRRGRCAKYNSSLVYVNSYFIGFGKWAILRLRWNKGNFFQGKSYIIFGNVELKWLTYLKNTELWSNISVISHDPCQLSWRVHGIYLCCFTSNRIILEHHFKIQNFAKGMWSKIFIAGYGFSAVAANCS